MKKTALVILMILVGFSAMAKTRKVTKKKTAVKGDIISVMVMHTGCFGHCPTYSVTINNEGMAIYSAIQFNTDSGDFQKNIGLVKAIEILTDLVKYRVDTCKDQYENLVPDLPNINYEITYKSKVKKIYSAKYGPDFLKDMTRKIDEVAKKKDGDAGWKRVPEKK